MPETAIDRRVVLQAVAIAPAIAAAMAARRACAASGDLLVVIAEIVAKPGKADALRDVMEPLAAAARQEPGCQHYSLLEDRQMVGRFLTYEVWTDPAALASHMHAAAAKAAGPRLAGLLAKAPTQTMLRELGAS